MSSTICVFTECIPLFSVKISVIYQIICKLNIEISIIIIQNCLKGIKLKDISTNITILVYILVYKNDLNLIFDLLKI